MHFLGFAICLKLAWNDMLHPTLYSRARIVSLLLFLLTVSAASAQDGAALYKARCVSCHDAPTGRIPPVSALKTMSPAKILAALVSGSMKQQAAGLTGSERYALITYLAAPAPQPVPPRPPAAFCRAGVQPASSDSESAAWKSWGLDLANTRFQTAAAAGITAATVPNLKLKWAFGLGDGTAVRSQVAVASGRVFVANLTGNVYSLHSRSGCIQWSFQAETPVHSSLTLGANDQAKGQLSLYFGDQHANVYALDAATGRLLWKAHVGEHFASLITGAPQSYHGLLS